MELARPGILLAIYILFKEKSTYLYVNEITVYCQELKFHLHCDASWVSGGKSSYLVIENWYTLTRMQKWQTGSGVALINRHRPNYRLVYKKIKWMDNLSILIGLNLKTCDLYEDELSASNIIKRLAKINSSTQLKYSILRN